MNKRPPRNGEPAVKIQETLLVDGNALFKNSLYGAKNQYNQWGNHIGGAYQFMTTLRKLLDERIYHRVYVFWDGKLSGKLRYDIYKSYKSDRGKDYENGTHPVDESELLQISAVWDYISHMFIRQLRDEIIESDDFIAHYCLNKKPNEKITICSSDRDFAQLIGDDVKIYFIDKKNYIDKFNFSSYFCYNLDNAALVKILTGDDSDSIKGIKGLGLKSLVKYFPDVRHRKVSLTEIIEQAKQQQETRKQQKKKPLKILDNIIHAVTDGVQGNKIYEINERLVNLKKPMMTENGIQAFNKLLATPLLESEKQIRNVFLLMERDGLDKAIGEYRYPEYLIPFKKLIDREKIIF